MECKDICEKLSDFIDGLLAEDERKLIQKHIDRCEKCLGKYKKMKETIELLQTLPEIKAPENFSEGVIQKISERQFQKQRRLTLWLGRFAFAEIIVLVLIILLNQPQKEQIIPEKKEVSQNIAQSEVVERQEAISKQELVKKQPKVEAPVLSEKRIVPEISIQLAYKTAVAERPVEKRLEADRIKEIPTERKGEPIAASPMLKGKLQLGSGNDIACTLTEKTSVESELIAIISTAKGKIISEQTFKDTEVSQVVCVEIPGQDYQDFIKRLNESFQIRNLPEIRDKNFPETNVRLKIEIFRQ
ncbi:MAG: zf-HC2 domain-containing protein [Candidatus Omnitrophica bacterium]|nr:zf-HC2 domain-containing protein [Candidatus Omnitrophota bacterium]